LQFHEIIRLEDPDRIFADGGAAEAVLEAKRAGKIRYVGFTGHKDPLVHLRMLEISEEVTELLSRTAQVAESGQYEPFKTDNVFDATAMNPDWLGVPAA
jgi:predicted aldo/keto reductase-like oxidoreductase